MGRGRGPQACRPPCPCTSKSTFLDTVIIAWLPRLVKVILVGSGSSLRLRPMWSSSTSARRRDRRRKELSPLPALDPCPLLPSDPRLDRPLSHPGFLSRSPLATRVPMVDVGPKIFGVTRKYSKAKGE